MSDPAARASVAAVRLALRAGEWLSRALVLVLSAAVMSGFVLALDFAVKGLPHP